MRLSLLYLAASLGLVGLLGTATYGLIKLYFQHSTDLALQYKMAIEFRARGLSLPPALAAAGQRTPPVSASAPVSAASYAGAASVSRPIS